MPASKLSELFRAYRWERKELLSWATLWKAEHTGTDGTQRTKIDTDWSAKDFSGQPNSYNSTSTWRDALGVLRGITLIAFECVPLVHCRREARRDSKTEDATTGAGDAIAEGRGSYMTTGSSWWRGHSGTSKALCQRRWIDCTQRPPLKSQRGNWRYSTALCLRPANIILKQFMQVLI